MLSLPDADGELARRLGEAGCTVAGRAGLVRIAFHLWNDEADLQRVGDALSTVTAAVAKVTAVSSSEVAGRS